MQRLMRFLWYAESTRQVVEQKRAHGIFAQNSLLHCSQFLCTNLPSLRQMFWSFHRVLIIGRFYAVMGPLPPYVKRVWRRHGVSRSGLPVTECDGQLALLLQLQQRGSSGFRPPEIASRSSWIHCLRSLVSGRMGPGTPRFSWCVGQPRTRNARWLGYRLGRNVCRVRLFVAHAFLDHRPKNFESLGIILSSKGEDQWVSVL